MPDNIVIIANPAKNTQSRLDSSGDRPIKEGKHFFPAPYVLRAVVLSSTPRPLPSLLADFSTASSLKRGGRKRQRQQLFPSFGKSGILWRNAQRGRRAREVKWFRQKKREWKREGIRGSGETEGPLTKLDNRNGCFAAAGEVSRRG